ncbi:MAG: hypothetical protein ACE5JS_22375, partial [Nitrospinota bacterium]
RGLKTQDLNTPRNRGKSTDLLAMNFSTGGHLRITFAMSILDKLANLRKNLGGHPDDEGEIAKGLASRAEEREIEELLKTYFRPYSETLYQNFSHLTGHCFDGLHEHLEKDIGLIGKSERERLKRLRIQRNLRHGTFLKKNDFERLFLESKGTTSGDLITLAFLLTLAFTLKPDSFLKNRPAIGP